MSKLIEYRPVGICMQQMQIEVGDDDRIIRVKLYGGCQGQNGLLARVVKGKHIDEVIEIFEGNNCRNGTSCADQISVALKGYKQQK